MTFFHMGSLLTLASDRQACDKANIFTMGGHECHTVRVEIDKEDLMYSKIIPDSYILTRNNLI